MAAFRSSNDPGGSTIAQQLAKQLYPQRPGVGGTLADLGLAVKLSLHLLQAPNHGDVPQLGVFRERVLGRPGGTSLWPSNGSTTCSTNWSQRAGLHRRKRNMRTVSVCSYALQ